MAFVFESQAKLYCCLLTNRWKLIKMQYVWSLITLVSLVFSFSAVYQWAMDSSHFSLYFDSILSPKAPKYFILKVLKHSLILAYRPTGGWQRTASDLSTMQFRKYNFLRWIERWYFYPYCAIRHYKYKDKRSASDLSTNHTYCEWLIVNNSQYNFAWFKGHKSPEYWCLVIHLTSVSTISYAESNSVAFFSKYKAAQPKRNLQFAKVTVSMSKFLVKLFNFPEFSSKCRVIYG
jgi:hypothetical protein